jgi:tetratricopeptide (TPR) repeat protein
LADQWASLPGLPDSDRADALTEGAQARAQVGDYAGAEAALQEALKARPADAEASFLLAEATRDRPEQALTRAEAAAAAPVPPRRRAAAYRLAADIRLDLGDLAGAREDVTRALELAPDDLDALVLAASLRRDEPKEASRHARAACAAADAQPSWRRAAAERLCARGLSEVNDFAGAMAALGRALALDPDDAATLHALVRVKRLSPAAALPAAGSAARDKAMPEDRARRALAEDPDDLEALRTLVEAARAAGRRPEAAELAERFTSAIRRSPGWQRVDAYRLSAQLWIELDDSEKALASLNRAEDLDPASVANQKLIGLAQRKFIPPAVSEAYNLAAQVRLSLGDAAGADATLERGLKLTPDNLELLRLMVQRKLAEARPREALPYAERMLAQAQKPTPAAFWNPEKQGLLSSSDAAKQGDIRAAQDTLETVRKALR